MVAVTHAPAPEGAARPVLPDKQMMIEAVKLLHPGRVVELRMLNLDGRGGTASGYFDQPALLAGAALRYSRRAEGIYITLNPVPVDLLARENNRVQERAKRTTTDDEVLRRVWLPVDLDPARPSGISASEHEHQAALEQARRAREWLSSEWGWHAPIFADSGNGAHLLYAIDLPNDAASTDLLKRCLAALARRFDTEAVKLDQSVYNAARIWKLYGSVARKGEHLPLRPHRLARIISAPDPVELVTRAQLEQVAGMTAPAPANEFAPGALSATKPAFAGSPPTTGRAPVSIAGVRDGWPPVEGVGASVAGPGGGTPPGASSDAGGPGRVTQEALLAWLERHGARVQRTKQGHESAIYVLERCPFAEHHAAGKACVTLSATGLPGFHCFAAGCANYHWQDVTALWGDGPLAPAAGLAVPFDMEPGDEPPADEEEQAQATEAARPWPEPPPDAVYRGLAGEIVRVFKPRTEADPLAILVQLLTAFGAALGSGPHIMVGENRHEPRLFTVIVGQSAKARKGDSWQIVRSLLADTRLAPRLLTSLSSGEGLIRQVRDDEVRRVPIKGQPGRYEEEIVEVGEPDKRLLMALTEMAEAFAVLRREGNTLSAILRDAWDHGELVVATKVASMRATGAYLSFIGHITEEELRHELTGMQAANGFANRFLWFAVRRGQVLDWPRPLPLAERARLSAMLAGAISRARAIGAMEMTPAGRMGWAKIYEGLSSGRNGLAGALLSRSEAQTLRLAMIYALLDGAAAIDLEHLMAAVGLWEYAERSVFYLFGGQSGNALAEKIEARLKEVGSLTGSEVHTLVGTHTRARDIASAMKTLEEQQKVTRELRKSGTGGGRPQEVWHWVAREEVSL